MSYDRVLRTAAWYGDLPINLEFPSEWDVQILWPSTPPPLTDEQIRTHLERPVGQAPIRQLCRGKSKPLVLVDDMNRPTPAGRVLPFVLRHFQDAGIPLKQVKIVVAGGSHGASRKDVLVRKIGREAAAACQLLVHDPARNIVKLGRTSFGTPVLVNREVVTSDFVMGIGGIYPNRTAGFGGGTKIALGILDIRAISYLHHRHAKVSGGWGSEAVQGDFRKDLDEVAQIIGLNTVVSLQVDADREVIRLASGDPRLYFKDEVAFAREAFSTLAPAEADVVIANAYPNDLSLTFVQMKGIYPLQRCANGVSRIVVASCSEGEGSHGLFPVVRVPLFHNRRDRLRRLSVMNNTELGQIIARQFRGWVGSNTGPGSNSRITETQIHKNPIWLFRTGTHSDHLPSRVREMRIGSSWPEIVRNVQIEQGHRRRLNVVVYPCAPLQIVNLPIESQETAESLQEVEVQSE